MSENTEAPEAVIFDLDGTLYLGEGLIPGADTTVQTLRDAGIRVTFLTNKPIASPDVYARKLTGLGIHASADDVLTSVTLTVDYLDRAKCGRRVFVLGEEYLKTTLTEAGYTIASRPDETDVVVVSLDRSMDCGKIHFAYQAVLGGARIVATNPDLICPIDDGEIVDAGVWIAALEALLKRPITNVLGKPSARCAEVVLARLGCDPGDALMVGDRMETDIRMAVDAGMRSGLVLSGVSTEKDIDRHEYAPDHVWQSVAEMPEQLGLL